MQYRLYKKPHTLVEQPDTDVRSFTPVPGKLYLAEETRQWKTTLVRMLFWIITAGKARIFYILAENQAVVHTSYVVGKCYKFPFLKKGDYEIGPCVTAPGFRGKGLYGKALARIVSEKDYKGASFYMFVSEDNDASIRGIEKAGFIRSGYVERTKLLKRYCRK